MTYFEWRERQANPRDRKVKATPCSYEVVDFTIEQASDTADEQLEFDFNKYLNDNMDLVS